MAIDIPSQSAITEGMDVSIVIIELGVSMISS